VTNLYALDGICHNAEPGTYGHECGKPAKWLGTGASGFQSGFCDDCKAHGYEAKGMVAWVPAGTPWRVEQWRCDSDFKGWQVVRDLDDGVKSYAALLEAPTGPVDGWRHRIAAQTLAVDLNKRELGI